MEWDISSLPAAAYLLEVKAGDVLIQEKIVKIKE